MRSCWRWGVWIVSAILVIATITSFSLKPTLHLLAANDYGGTSYELKLYNGVFVYQTYGYDYFVDDLEEYSPSSKVRHVLKWSTGSSDSLIKFRVKKRMWFLPSRPWKAPFLDQPDDMSLGIPLISMTLLALGLGLYLLIPIVQRRRLVGVCPECGYSLAGLDVGVCPECGEEM